MPVSAIALYASSPSSVCSTTHPCSINTHSSHDLDLNSRSSSSAPSSASSSQKPPLGGLSCLLSSPLALSKLPPSAPSFPHNGEELTSLWHDRGDEMSSSCNYSHTSPLCSSSKRDQSPVSVFQGPFSSSSSVISSSRSSPVRALQEKGGDVSVYGSVRGGTSGLFNGFVRNALGSVVDCDPRRFKANSSTLLVDELTFDMEGFEEVEPEPYAKDLLLGAQLRHRIFYEEFVIKAFYEAERAHRGQMRASGDPYFQHCVETAVLLALVGASSIVVAAGLLHDTLDDSFMCYDDIFRTFGVGVADLVKGVSKLSQLSQLARKNNTASKTVEADRLHTMFLAMADARAVLIKLADRLHNMMTLDALPLVKRSRFAKETLEIFAPLANRLGIYNWKQQLENLCFKHLNPDEYRKLSSMVLNSYDEAMATSATDKLEQALKDEGISYQGLARRHKSLYSIYCKMLKKKLTVDEIHDIHGLRLIVEKEEECYRALEVVCQLWLEVPGKFKDYITQPKYNGYRSLHTVVTGEGKVPFEVQIRTKEMHLQAEFGFAAHWRYKESDYEHSSFVLQMVEWARWVVTWQCEKMGEDQPSIGCATDAIKPPPCTFPSHSSDCPNSLPHTCDNGPVFVILMENDKMAVQEFPANATVIDLLDRVGGRGSARWLRYGFSVKEEFRLRVNHEPVSDPSCKLNMGDVVELSPAIPDKSLVEYREEIQRMYDGALATSTSSPAGWKS